MSPETRNLIDGRLVDSETGKTFPNVNPATEEVIGATADATAADMDRAIGAARRAFDETRWSTDAAFRARCLRQLHAALTKAKDELREVVVAEAGSPIILGYSVQCDATIDWFPFWADVAERFTYESPMPDKIGRAHV